MQLILSNQSIFETNFKVDSTIMPASPYWNAAWCDLVPIVVSICNFYTTVCHCDWSSPQEICNVGLIIIFIIFDIVNSQRACHHWEPFIGKLFTLQGLFTVIVIVTFGNKRAHVVAATCLWNVTQMLHIFMFSLANRHFAWCLCISKCKIQRFLHLISK